MGLFKKSTLAFYCSVRTSSLNFSHKQPYVTIIVTVTIITAIFPVYILLLYNSVIDCIIFYSINDEF
jgi:hypothetical protein